MKRYFLFSIALLFLESCIFTYAPFDLGGIGGSKQGKYKEKILQFGSKEKILVIPINGVISDSPNSESSLLISRRSESMLAQVSMQLNFAQTIPNLTAVVLKINSPGGTVTASDILYNEILQFKTQTGIPVFAHFMDTAASGAYYISMATDGIYAHPTSITGSIGVVMQGFNLSEGMKKIGVQEQTFVSGPNKALGSMFSEMSNEQKQILQEIVNGLFTRFYSVVQSGRPTISDSQLKKLADGRVYTAEQARANGLIDGIGYFDEIITRVQQHPKYRVSLGRNTNLWTLNANRTKPTIVVLTRMDDGPESIYSVENNNITPNLIDKLSNTNTESKFYYIWNP